MFRGKSWLKENLSVLPQKALIISFLLVVGTTSILSLPKNYSSNEMLQTLFSIADNVCWTVATGFLSAVGASLFLCSKEIQNNIAKKMSSGSQVRFSIVFLSFIILMLITTLAVCLVCFAIGFVNIELDLAIFQFLPQLLFVSLLLTLLISPIYALLALSLDSVKLSLLVGLSVSFIILILTGFPGNPSRYPEIAFFAPAHLFLALLFISTGAYGSFSMTAYVGVSFELVNLVVPVIVLSFLMMTGYYGSKKMFIENKQRWLDLRTSDEWIETGISMKQSTASVSTDNLQESIRCLKERRRKAITVIMVAVILTSFASYGYTHARQEESLIVAYESPVGGESVNIGEWIYGSFIGEERSQTEPLYPTLSGRVIDLYGSQVNVTINFAVSQMTMTEFHDLNETELKDTFHYGTSTQGSMTGRFTGIGKDVYQESEYVWILRIVDANGRTSGPVNIWFQIVLATGPL